MTQKHHLRADCARCLHAVVDQSRSLSDVLPNFAAHYTDSRDKALLQEICFGVLRWLPKLDFYCAQLLEKPLKGSKRPLQFLLYVGIYQLTETRIPAHAAISETVAGAEALKAKGLKGLLNAVLRNFQRQQPQLEQKAQQIATCRYGHPNWLIKTIQTHYAESADALLEANQQKAPMWLRINQQKTTLDTYQQALAENAIAADSYPLLANLHGTNVTLKLATATNVERLHRFNEGFASVQDRAAQQAAALLAPQPNEHVLDACAAPGGKTCHLLEIEPSLSLIALDADETRLTRVTDNLSRLNLHATTIAADASTLTWWDEKPFDRILLDAPCSATGVIRRHPDIKWLRRLDDIKQLAALQRQILNNLWKTLKVGGTLVYATCSIMPEENRSQIAAFLAETPDATLLPIIDSESPDSPGWQILPGQDDMDGFYYARLIKQPL